ncbi:MAG: hypothetical protein AABY22_23005 [Nanoarchaeota archaeon]
MKADFVMGKHRKLGDFMGLTYQDGSKVYFCKKGLTFTLPKSKFKKEWNKKRKDFGFTFNVGEIELLLKALEKFTEPKKNKQ